MSSTFSTLRRTRPTVVVCTYVGELIRSVVWPGAVVDKGERLVDAIRADGLTVRPYGLEGRAHG